VEKPKIQTKEGGSFICIEEGFVVARMFILLSHLFSGWLLKSTDLWFGLFAACFSSSSEFSFARSWQAFF
jgi:hypothetical protein